MQAYTHKESSVSVTEGTHANHGRVNLAASSFQKDSCTRPVHALDATSRSRHSAISCVLDDVMAYMRARENVMGLCLAGKHIPGKSGRHFQ
jgi:hypothetical protein